MAIKSKTQLGIDIAASTFGAGEQVILQDMVDSYEDIFPQLTTVQRDALTPTSGQIVYNTDTDRYEYFNSADWIGIGQDLGTPMQVKVEISSAQILALHTTPITLVSAPGAGYAIAPIYFAYKYTYGSAAYANGANLRVFNSTKTRSDYFLNLNKDIITAAANRSGVVPAIVDDTKDAIVENDRLVLDCATAYITGDGSLTIWVNYMLIAI